MICKDFITDRITALLALVIITYNANAQNRIVSFEIVASGARYGNLRYARSCLAKEPIGRKIIKGVEADMLKQYDTDIAERETQYPENPFCQHRCSITKRRW